MTVEQDFEGDSASYDAHMTRREFLKEAALGALLFADAVGLGILTKKKFGKDYSAKPTKDDFEVVKKPKEITEEALAEKTEREDIAETPEKEISELRKIIGQYDVEKKRTINRLIVHHTASSAKNQTAESIRRYHMDVRCYSDIGYHFVIRDNGTVEYGRPVKRRGAHAKGNNWDSIGVVMTGNFEVSSPSQAQLNSLYEVLEIGLDEYSLSEDKIYGHNEIPYATACPGKNVDMAAIRKEVRNRMAVEVAA